MNKKILLLLLMVVGLFFKVNAHEHGHEHAAEQHEEIPKGPHKGRLLGEKDFQVEVTIYEPGGVPPRFRIYFYEDGKEVSPNEVNFSMVLERINRKENIPFKHEGKFLESTVEAYEPHSFHVNIEATYKGKHFSWQYDSFEGRVELTQEAIEANKIKIDIAGPVDMKITVPVMGKIVPNQEETAPISARYSGIVKAVSKKLGDHVKRNETLAVIESDESLQNYEVKSPVEGTVIKKNINPGAHITAADELFLVSNLNMVWADFNLYVQDLSKLKVNDPIEIRTLEGRLKELSTVSYISPLSDQHSQTVLVRAILPNEQGKWKIGLFVAGEILVDQETVPVAVKSRALQTFRDWDIVFLNVGNIFEVKPIKLGKQNEEWVEVTSGLIPGDRYVTENSFVLKADIGKSEAKHEH